MAFERSKALLELKRIQGELAKAMVETEAGSGAVTVQMNGEQKIQSIHLDADLIRDAELSQVERWIESAVSQAITRSQQLAADKMKNLTGGLGIPGL